MTELKVSIETKVGLDGLHDLEPHEKMAVLDAILESMSTEAIEAWVARSPRRYEFTQFLDDY